MKDPAFLFYDGDAARDVSHMNRLERGGYFDIMQAQRKFHGITMEQARKILGSDFDSIWPSIEMVMERGDDGKFRISWLTESIANRAKHAENQRKRIQDYWDKKKAEPPKRKNHGNTTVLPLVNENEIENEEEEVNAKANAKHLHAPMIKIYTDFMAKREVPPMIERADYAALKKIRAYLLTATTEDKVLEAWEHFLDTWERWPEWNQTKLRIRDIHSGMQNLVAHLKKTKKKSFESKLSEIWDN